LTAIEHRALLLHISRMYGIDGDYFDVWGHRHEVPSTTQEALLEAMGLPLEQLDIMPSETEREIWSTILEPVYVIPQNEPRPTLVLHLKGDDRIVHWVYHEEGGSVSDGIIDSATLPHLETRDFDGQPWHRYLWTLPFALREGRHQISARTASGQAASSPLLVTPTQCYRPECVRTGRVWGLAVQLYALRSHRNWGIGDFTDLTQLVQIAADAGAAAIGLNPLHALFLHNPDHASPYSPSTRLFLNPLYIDVEAIPEFAQCDAARERVAQQAFQSRLSTYREAPYVDYRGVWGLKQTVLEDLHRWFQKNASVSRRESFKAFQNHGGEALFRYAVHEALQERFFSQDPSVWGWPLWSNEYRQPNAPAVHEFAKIHSERVEFFTYLQWQADAQLHAAGEVARERLGIGLYRDLAVGVDRAGAETWASQDLYIFGASVGCPPDEFNLNGQNWGLPPLSPRALKCQAYEPYISTWSAT